MKKLLFKLLPKKIKRYLLSYRGFQDDIVRYNNYVMSGNLTQPRLISRLILKYHVLEKGLTMPDMRPGFGKQVVKDLLQLCDKYLEMGYDPTDIHFIQSIQVLNEYVRLHKNIEFELDGEITEEIYSLSKQTNILKFGTQNIISKENYFKYSKAEFKEFCLSRHSVRAFSDEEVEIETIKKAVFLAQKGPSSCNRQPSRVYILNNREFIDKVLDAQKGNRGFGHTINKVIVLTAEVGVFSGYAERNEAFINAGLFAMGVLYGLHYYEIGAIPLAYIAVNKDEDKLVRSICGIPDSEVVCMFIGCGIVRNTFSIATSVRYPVDSITKIIE